jgi:predicted alpha/beta superfamily hydrolase
MVFCCLLFVGRADAAQWPGGGVTAYLERLKTEVIPWVATQYGASIDPADLAFGGSSFGGIAALAAGLQGPSNCGFGALLVESPSLWIGPDEAFLKDIQAYNGQWPQRVGCSKMSLQHVSMPKCLLQLPCKCLVQLCS